MFLSFIMGLQRLTPQMCIHIYVYVHIYTVFHAPEFKMTVHLCSLKRNKLYRQRLSGTTLSQFLFFLVGKPIILSGLLLEPLPNSKASRLDLTNFRSPKSWVQLYLRDSIETLASLCKPDPPLMNHGRD